MRILTRPVTAEDRPVWSGLWRKYLEFYETEVSRDVYDESWRRILDSEIPMHSALAVLDGAPVGLVNFLYHKTFWDIRDKCYLNDLYVTEAARGAGAGAALIAYVNDHAAAQGAGEVYWMTARDNATARRLYDRVAVLTPFIKYKTE
jgi:GNAT superfamily N-acetyltransferase